MTDTNHRRTGKVQVERLINGSRDGAYQGHSQMKHWSKKKKRLRRKERRKGEAVTKGETVAAKASDFEVQCRSEEGGLSVCASFAEALKKADEDTSIWKISFTLPTGERIRLVRNESDEWVYENLLEVAGLKES